MRAFVAAGRRRPAARRGRGQTRGWVSAASLRGSRLRGDACAGGKARPRRRRAVRMRMPSASWLHCRSKTMTETELWIAAEFQPCPLVASRPGRRARDRPRWRRAGRLGSGVGTRSPFCSHTRSVCGLTRWPRLPRRARKFKGERPAYFSVSGANVDDGALREPEGSNPPPPLSSSRGVSTRSDSVGNHARSSIVTLESFGSARDPRPGLWRDQASTT